jgi:hypothetical protein
MAKKLKVEISPKQGGMIYMHVAEGYEGVRMSKSFTSVDGVTVVVDADNKGNLLGIEIIGVTDLEVATKS